MEILGAYTAITATYLMQRDPKGMLRVAKTIREKAVNQAFLNDLDRIIEALEQDIQSNSFWFFKK